jgi:hypothetical protein
MAENVIQCVLEKKTLIHTLTRLKCLLSSEPRIILLRLYFYLLWCWWRENVCALYDHRSGRYVKGCLILEGCHAPYAVETTCNSLLEVVIVNILQANIFFISNTSSFSCVNQNICSVTDFWKTKLKRYLHPMI